MFKHICYLGTPQFAADILLDIKHKVTSVITMPDKPSGRGYVVQETEVKKMAILHGLEVFQPENVSELSEVLEKMKPDLLIAVAYGMIFTPELVDSYNFINIHASLLPKYRGASPIQAPILNGDKLTGVTLMKIGYKVDDGDIISKKEVVIEREDNFQTLSRKLQIAGSELLLEQLEKPHSDWKYLKQDNAQASFTKKISKEDGCVDLKKDIPESIIRKLKAYTLWPGVFTVTAEKKRVKILSADIVEGKLEIKKLQMEGKREVSYAEFVSAYGEL